MPDDYVMPHRLYLFGASLYGKRVVEFLQSDGRIKVTAFLDNDPAKWGTRLLGVPVLNPATLPVAAGDPIVITSVFGEAIMDQLQKLGYGEQAFPNLYQYIRRYHQAWGVHAAAILNPYCRECIENVGTTQELAWREGQSIARRNAESGDASYHVCVIVTASYADRARVVLKSVWAQDPLARATAVVLDDGQPAIFPEEERIGRLEVVNARSIMGDLRDTILERYAHPFDQCMAVRPYAFEWLLKRLGERPLFYLDSDILVFKSLMPLVYRLGGAPFGLTPQLMRPERDGDFAMERMCLKYGLLNGGMYLLRGHPVTFRFLDWLKERLAQYCIRDTAAGMYGDQRWLDLALAFFPEMRILDDPTANVAPWNLHERDVEWDRDGFRVDGLPLTFFHYSGFDLDYPLIQVALEYQGREAMRDTLIPLLGVYRDQVIRARGDVSGRGGEMIRQARPTETQRVTEGLRQ